jgi:putative oxidoreductase
MALTSFITGINQALSRLQSPLLLAFRLYVSYVFFNSGLQKISNWDMTLTLFEYEYAVPLLPYELAAYLATAGELLLPIVITLGLGTRLFAIALSILNVMAVVSYYEALAKVGQVTPHIFWGACLMTNIVFGAGYFSIDHWLKTRNNSES